jgi:tetratricopeptide (TPR) repeat protein
MCRASLIVVSVVTATVASLQSEQPAARQPKQYLDAVLAYRQGDIDNAVDQLVDWPPDDLKRANSILADDRVRDWRLRASAAMLHVEVILRHSTHPQTPVSLHLAMGQRVVDNLDVPEFVRRWYSLAGSIYLSNMDPGAANAIIDRGLRLFKDDARLQMLAGEVEELRGHIADGNLHDRETVRLTPPGGRRSLLFAESSYRRAVELDPTLDEARLRLGRVVFLRNDPKAARAELERVARDTAIPRLRYLAHLFLGAVSEYQNDLATARVEYRQALVAGPECQTPYVALTFVEAALGHTDVARDLIAHYAALSTEAAADPWWFYQNGGVDEESLVSLRQQVLQ